MAPVLVTLNDLKGHSLVAGLCKCNTSNICAVFYQISTDSMLTRSLSDSWASCLHVKLHYYGRRTISGKLLAFGFAATLRLLSNYFDLLFIFPVIIQHSGCNFCSASPDINSTMLVVLM